MIYNKIYKKYNYLTLLREFIFLHIIKFRFIIEKGEIDAGLQFIRDIYKLSNISKYRMVAKFNIFLMENMS